MSVVQSRSVASGSLAIAVVAVATFYFAYLWLFSDAAWLHPEMLGSSYYVWVLPETDNLASQLRRVFDWKGFDPNVNRVRPLNDLFEVLDAIARPYATAAFGPHASLLPSTVLTIVLVPGLFFAWARSVLKSWPSAAFLTVVLLSSTAFLSLTVASLHPAKRIHLILLCSALYFAQRTTMSGRGYWPMWFSLLAGFFADELGLASYPVIGILYGREIFSNRKRALSFLLLPLLFVIVVKWALPSLYLHLSVHGAWDAMADAKKLGVFGYLLDPAFYVSAGQQTARTVLSMFGIATHIPATELAAWAAIIGTTLWLARSWADRTMLSLLALVLASGYATLLDWYPFPNEVSYLGSFNYYYHSSIGVLVLVWATFASRQLFAAARPWIATAWIGGCILISYSNVLTFELVNRLTSIIHLSPYSNKELTRALAEKPKPVVVLHADALAERAIFDRTVAELFNGRDNGFVRTAEMLKDSPLIGVEQVKLLFHAYYPWRKVDAVSPN
jgi:hypothetical protein